MKELNPSIYKEEVKKFKEDINWMREATSKMFGKELIDRLEQFKAQCEDGRVMSTTVNSVHKLIERFETIFNGYIDRKEFKKVVKELKEYMEGTDAEMLRVDDEFREVVRMKMSELSKIAIKETNDIELERGFEL
jgi:chemotaxis regulatin CheY-phosphate phosphatase CheZ